MSRPAKIIIDLAALAVNYNFAKEIASNSKTMAVVKADAYGHGAIKVAQTLDPLVEMFAVSCLEEALVLRNSGIVTPILLLEGCFSADEIPVAQAQNCQLVLHNEQQISDLENALISQPISVWLKVDSGMHRLGFKPEDIELSYLRLKACINVKDILLMSHFACADNLGSDSVALQLSSFDQCVASIPTKNIPMSMANSAGILAWPESHRNWNRPGIMLYGLSPLSEGHEQGDKLKAVMTFQSEVIALRHIPLGESVGYGYTWTAQRPSVIATVAVGYGDGYPRSAKSGTPVLINNQKVPLVGRVSMDLISVDVTDLQNVNLGDKVTLWGRELPANEVASWADTIGYELVTRMPRRVERVYKY